MVSSDHAAPYVRGVTVLHRDHALSGLLFIILGNFFGIVATGYRFGTAASMGAGFVPLCLSVMLVVLGVALLLQAVVRSGETIDWGNAWPFVVVIGSIAAFALLLRPLGFAGTAFLTVMASSFAGPRLNWSHRLLLAFMLSAATSLIFIRLLGLPLGIWPAMLR